MYVCHHQSEISAQINVAQPEFFLPGISNPLKTRSKERLLFWLYSFWILCPWYCCARAGVPANKKYFSARLLPCNTTLRGLLYYLINSLVCCSMRKPSLRLKSKSVGPRARGGKSSSTRLKKGGGQQPCTDADG